MCYTVHTLTQKVNTMTYRIGFACKYMDPNQDQTKKLLEDIQRPFNTRSTTARWLNSQEQHVAEQRLKEIITHNVNAIEKLLLKVADFEPALRMMRMGSDILPMYTHADWKGFYDTNPSFMTTMQQQFRRIGAIARDRGVRVSFHPGQFCCIVSDRPDVVVNSIEELEYHADIVRWMGFGRQKLDFKINIHLSGKLGMSGLDSALDKMSPELRNCLTLENDEYQAGLDDLIHAKEKVGIVLDIHHHLIKEGEYIQPNDDRIKHVIDSWQGVRPTFHYSQSKEEYMSGFASKMPTMTEMLEVAPKSKLRAHSMYYNNIHVNKWALSHLAWGDMMSESKAKNLSARQLYNQHLGI